MNRTLYVVFAAPFLRPPRQYFANSLKEAAQQYIDDRENDINGEKYEKLYVGVIDALSCFGLKQIATTTYTTGLDY